MESPVHMPSGLDYFPFAHADHASSEPAIEDWFKVFDDVLAPHETNLRDGNDVQVFSQQQHGAIPTSHGYNFSTDPVQAHAVHNIESPPAIELEEFIDTSAIPDLQFEDTKMATPHEPIPTTFPAELDLQPKPTAKDDSDCSWDEKDEEEDWTSNLRDVLSQFREQTDRLTTVTPPLPTRQRRKVHSMCYLMNLSHASIVEGAQKRVLIAKCHIRGSEGEKVWNPRREGWSKGCVYPGVVALWNIQVYLNDRPFDVSGKVLQDALEDAGLPIPLHISVKADYGVERGMLGIPAVFLLYESMQSARIVVASIPREGFYGHRMSFCEYLYVAERFYPPEKSQDSVDGIVSKMKARPQNTAIKSGTKIATPRDEPAEHQDMLSGQPGGVCRTLETHVPPPHWEPPSMKRSYSYSQYHSESNASDASVGSSFSFVGSEVSSNGNTSKRPRRQEKAIGGYPCPSDGCFMIFDRECDRRKHMKIHSDERAHICSECGAGFHWPKDLRRHWTRHHPVAESYQPMTGMERLPTLMQVPVSPAEESWPTDQLIEGRTSP